MKTKSSSYFVFNEYGEATFPSKQLIVSNEKEGFNTGLILDSSVCLELVKFVDYRKKAVIERTKLINYLDYIHKHPVQTIPLLGLLELCHSSSTMSFDPSKLEDFKNRIDFIEQVPMNRVRSFRFDYQKEYKILRRLSFETTSLNSLKPLLLTTYCCLLKIRALCLMGISKNNAKKHTENLIKWMADDLGMIMGIEFQLALNVFGGVTDFRKMIWLDGNPGEIKKKLWGTCWDILHARIGLGNERDSELFGGFNRTFFITKDYSLFKLMSQLCLRIKIDHKGNSPTSSVFSASFELPHLDRSYVNEINQYMMDMLLNRFNTVKEYNDKVISQMIWDLEQINNISK